MVDDYPDCKHRVDTEEIERKMRGVKNAHKAELAGLCKKIYDECIGHLERTTELIENLRDSLCDKDGQE